MASKDEPEPLQEHEPEHIRKTFLIRHFSRQDTENENVFKEYIESIKDIELKKIVSINIPINDDLEKFQNETININKKNIFFERYYHPLIIKEIQQIITTNMVTKTYRYGPKKGITETVPERLTTKVINYFDPKLCEIWSSPFLRCLQTAMFIAKLIGVKKITVHYGLSELCIPSILKEYAEHLQEGGHIDIDKVFLNTLSRCDTSMFKLCIIKEGRTMINDFDSSDNNDDKYFERISSTVSYIHNRQNGLQYKFIIGHADSLRPYSVPSKIMDFYIRYDITDKIKEHEHEQVHVPVPENVDDVLTGGSSKYDIYMKKYQIYKERNNRYKMAKYKKKLEKL